MAYIPLLTEKSEKINKVQLNNILPHFASPNLTGPRAVDKSTIVPLCVTRMIPSFTSCEPILRTAGIKSLHALGESARAT